MGLRKGFCLMLAWAQLGMPWPGPGTPASGGSSGSFAIVSTATNYANGANSITISGVPAGARVFGVVFVESAGTFTLTFGSETMTKLTTGGSYSGCSQADGYGDSVCFYYLASATGGETTVSVSGTEAIGGYAIYTTTWSGAGSLAFDSLYNCPGSTTSVSCTSTPAGSNEIAIAGYACTAFGGNPGVSGSPVSATNVFNPNTQASAVSVLSTATAQTMATTTNNCGATGNNGTGNMWFWKD